MQQHERDNNTVGTRSPTESEIIEGYSVPYSQPEQNQVSSYNPPGTYGPFPPSYNPTPPSPNPGYVAATRGSFEQPRSIEYINDQQPLPNLYYNNISPEFFNQQQPLPNLYNNLPSQIPMSIPLDVPAQQLYLKYPNTNNSSSSTPIHQQPYFPPGYVPSDETDKKGKGIAKISKKFRIGN
ncbi:hypothetical protein RhiirC2_731571 [Rhizophagus irregularis]|nr:hypothetical protein RhiirC2_731571 [Rhizophagus irregularis]